MYTTHAPLVGREANEIVPARLEAAAALAKQEKTIRDATSRATNHIGGALLVIRDQRLYHAAGYDRFPLYCEQVWGFKKSRAYQFIDFHKLIVELSTNVEVRGAPLPQTEAQARHLLQLKDTASQCTIWKDVLHRNGECATKDDVQDAVDYYFATKANPARCDQPRDEIIREYREEKAVAKTARRVPARPMLEPLTPPSHDEVPHSNLGAIKSFISTINATREVLLAEIAKEERPKLNDLIGELRRLADDLERDMDALNDREEGGSGGSI